MELPNHSYEEETRLAELEKAKFFKSVFAARGMESHLHFAPFRDYDFVYLTKPLAWRSDPHHEWQFKGITRVEAVTNFVTDLTSVPRVFWSLVPKQGSYAYGAVVHDYLYWHQSLDGEPIERETADRIFKLAMDDMKVSPGKTATIFKAVRWFGGGAWRHNQKLKSQGERRLLLRRPDRPDVSWQEWKSDPENFGDW